MSCRPVIGWGRWAAIKQSNDNVQVEGLAVTLEAIMAGDGTGTMKQDHVWMGTEIMDDVLDLVNR